MVRAGKIVAQCLGYILAKEDAAGVLHRVQHGKRVVHADLQMLGGDDIHGFDGFAHVIGHDDLAVGVHARAGDGGAGQLRDLYLQLGTAKIPVVSPVSPPGLPVSGVEILPPGFSVGAGVGLEDGAL